MSAILVRWHPGYMSAPHTYVTDRLCFVISGTWWVNSGETFEPENTLAKNLQVSYLVVTPRLSSV